MLIMDSYSKNTPPSAISGLQLWLDASSISGLSDNDPVASWEDLSGQGNDADQSTSGFRPIYKTNILNGRPVVRFDGVDDRLDTSSLFSGSSARTMIAVYNHDSSESNYNHPICGQHGTESTGQWFMMQARTRDVTGDPYFAGYADDLIGEASPNSNYKIVTIAYTTTLSIYTNGSLSNSGAKTLNTDGTNFSIGYETGGLDFFLDGDIAEIIVYDSELSSSARVSVEGYLSSKYAIAI